MDNPVAKFFAALKDRDLDRALSVVAEDVVFEAQGPNTVPIYGKFIGKKGVVEFLSILGELFNTEAFEIYKLVAVDNYIFAHGYMQHQVKKTERIFKCEFALVCTSKNGLITYYKMFEDTAALSEAYNSDRS
ncbi:MAG: nuclear transport factor 2 family protein [Cyanobacteriota bacterium]|nr:nuclear transport factor 2 family protein [Cyanobacteriota bacterium]